MVDKVAQQTEVQKVNEKNQDSKSGGCEEKDICFTLGGLVNSEVQ